MQICQDLAVANLLVGCEGRRALDNIVEESAAPAYCLRNPKGREVLAQLLQAPRLVSWVFAATKCERSRPAAVPSHAAGAKPEDANNQVEGERGQSVVVFESPLGAFAQFLLRFQMPQVCLKP